MIILFVLYTPSLVLDLHCRWSFSLLFGLLSTLRRLYVYLDLFVCLSVCEDCLKIGGLIFVKLLSMIGFRTRSSLLYISVYPFPWNFSFIHLLTVCEVALLCYYLTVILVWLSGYTSVSINKVILRWAQLVLGWVTVSWDQLPVQKNLVSVYNQPLGSTQPGHPSMGRCDKYQPKGDALQMGSKGRYSLWMGGR